MFKSQTSEKQPQRGRQAIEEAARLLQQMRFSETHGAYAEGQHTTVSVDPRWNGDNETLRVLISCYAFGHRRVDWAQLPVHIVPDGGRAGVHAIAWLDTRGQAAILQLPPGGYRLALRVKPVRVETVFHQPLDRLAAQGEDEELERRVWHGAGEEGAVLWTIEETEEGDVQIAFETSTEELAGRVIEFYLVDPHSKRVCYSQHVTLEPTRTPSKWEGWCSLGPQTEVQGPYELIFEIVPLEETE